MNKTEKIAVFDFCETLVPFQSADKYIEYVSAKHHSFSASFWKTTQKLLWKFKVVRVLNHFFPNGSINKRLLLKQLKGIDQNHLDLMAESFYNEIIKQSLISEVISQLKQKQKEGYRIIIDSGGFDIYLKYFIKDFDISEGDLLCTKLAFRKGVFTGSFEEPDCMGETKVTLLENIIDRNNSYVEAYSDSITDLPLLTYADYSFVIIEEGKSNWVENNNNNLNTILWHR